MKVRKIFLAVLLLIFFNVFLGAMFLSAQPRGQHPLKKALDINGDGIIGPREKKAARIYRKWREDKGSFPLRPLDLNRDGMIDEWETQVYKRYSRVVREVKRGMPPGQARGLRMRESANEGVAGAPAAAAPRGAAMRRRPTHPLGGPPGLAKRYIARFVNRERVKRYGGFFFLGIGGIFSLSDTSVLIGMNTRYQITQVVGIKGEFYAPADDLNNLDSLAKYGIGINLNLNPEHRVNPYIGLDYIWSGLKTKEESMYGFGGLELFFGTSVSLSVEYRAALKANGSNSIRTKLGVYF